MLKILWKRGEIAPEEQFLLFFTIFSYLMLGFYVKTRIGFSLRDQRLFEITEVEIMRVDCIIIARDVMPPRSPVVIFLWKFLEICSGWSGGAMVQGKLPVSGRPTNLDLRRARAYCACSMCGWGLFRHFFSLLSFILSFSLSLWETARNGLKYCLKGPLSPKQPTNQIKICLSK